MLTSGLAGVDKGGANSSMGPSIKTAGATSGGVTASAGAATTSNSVGNSGQSNTVAASGGTPGQGTATATGGLATLSEGGTTGSVVNTTIGGVIATGGVAATGCGDTQTSADNCGTCGHSCLGGTCVQGMCHPVVVVVSENESTSSLWPQALDDEFLYYGRPLSSPTHQLLRVRKDATGGAGTSMISSSCVVKYSLTPTKLYFSRFPCGEEPNMAETVTIFSCSTGECSSPDSSWEPTARLVESRTRTPYAATLDRVCDATLCVSWWNSQGQSVTTYRDASSWLPPIPLHSGSWDAIAYGDSVYWLQPLYDPSENYLHDVLLSVNSASLARAQLAGQWPRNVGLVDANPRSVIARQMLNSEVNEFYRVPRPLGLGDNPPRALGIAGDSATEDASGFYWMDDNGTVSTCDPEDCVATQKVLANAQTGGNGLLADDKALYWGRSNPPAVMRLAK